MRSPYQAFIPELDANGDPVIDPATGQPTDSTNDAKLENALYEGNPLPTIDDAAGTDETLTNRSIAVQKSVAVVGGGDPLPGATVEYTLNFQVSDYFEFSNVLLDDELSDGQRFDTTFTPTFTFTDNGAVQAGNFAPGDFTVTLNSDGPPPTPLDGSTDIQFRLSNALLGAGGDGLLTGDQFGGDPINTASVGTIVYRAEIQEAFSDTFPSGDTSVDLGDSLSNSVDITGTLPSFATVSDSSAASLDIASITAAKSIYAINNSTSFTNPTVSAGSTVTYRLITNLPSGDVENLTISDFLPLPVFDATTLSGPIGAASAAVPAAGSIQFGPSHTLPDDGTLKKNDGSNWTSADISIPAPSADSNSISFNFGSFDDPSGGRKLCR